VISMMRNGYWGEELDRELQKEDQEKQKDAVDPEAVSSSGDSVEHSTPSSSSSSISPSPSSSPWYALAHYLYGPHNLPLRDISDEDTVSCIVGSERTDTGGEEERIDTCSAMKVDYDSPLPSSLGLLRKIAQERVRSSLADHDTAWMSSQRPGSSIPGSASMSRANSQSSACSSRSSSTACLRGPMSSNPSRLTLNFPSQLSQPSSTADILTQLLSSIPPCPFSSALLSGVLLVEICVRNIWSIWEEGKQQRLKASTIVPVSQPTIVPDPFPCSDPMLPPAHPIRVLVDGVEVIQLEKEKTMRDQHKASYKTLETSHDESSEHILSVSLDGEQQHDATEHEGLKGTMHPTELEPTHQSSLAQISTLPPPSSVDSSTKGSKLSKKEFKQPILESITLQASPNHPRHSHVRNIDLTKELDTDPIASGLPSKTHKSIMSPLTMGGRKLPWEENLARKVKEDSLRWNVTVDRKSQPRPKTSSVVLTSPVFSLPPNYAVRQKSLQNALRMKRNRESREEKKRMREEKKRERKMMLTMESASLPPSSVAKSGSDSSFVKVGDGLVRRTQHVVPSPGSQSTASKSKSVYPSHQFASSVSPHYTYSRLQSKQRNMTHSPYHQKTDGKELYKSPPPRSSVSDHVSASGPEFQETFVRTSSGSLGVPNKQTMQRERSDSGSMRFADGTKVPIGLIKRDDVPLRVLEHINGRPIVKIEGTGTRGRTWSYVQECDSSFVEHPSVRQESVRYIHDELVGKHHKPNGMDKSPFRHDAFSTPYSYANPSSFSPVHRTFSHSMSPSLLHECSVGQAMGTSMSPSLIRSVSRPFLSSSCSNYPPSLISFPLSASLSLFLPPLSVSPLAFLSVALAVCHSESEGKTLEQVKCIEMVGSDASHIGLTSTADRDSNPMLTVDIQQLDDEDSESSSEHDVKDSTHIPPASTGPAVPIKKQKSGSLLPEALSRLLFSLRSLSSSLSMHLLTTPISPASREERSYKSQAKKNVEILSNAVEFIVGCLSGRIVACGWTDNEYKTEVDSWHREQEKITKEREKKRKKDNRRSGVICDPKGTSTPLSSSILGTMSIDNDPYTSMHTHVPTPLSTPYVFLEQEHDASYSGPLPEQQVSASSVSMSIFSQAIFVSSIPRHFIEPVKLTHRDRKEKLKSLKKKASMSMSEKHTVITRGIRKSVCVAIRAFLYAMTVVAKPWLWRKDGVEIGLEMSDWKHILSYRILPIDLIIIASLMLYQLRMSENEVKMRKIRSLPPVSSDISEHPSSQEPQSLSSAETEQKPAKKPKQVYPMIFLLSLDQLKVFERYVKVDADFIELIEWKKKMLEEEARKKSEEIERKKLLEEEKKRR
ncbi:hypothetical protein ADUPG1_011584, partial [Aduncisulcus paluster]